MGVMNLAESMFVSGIVILPSGHLCLPSILIILEGVRATDKGNILCPEVFLHSNIHLGNARPNCIWGICFQNETFCPRNAVHILSQRRFPEGPRPKGMACPMLPYAQHLLMIPHLPSFFPSLLLLLLLPT